MGNQVVAAFSGVPPKFSKRYISVTKRSYDLKFSFFNSIYLTVNWQGDLKGGPRRPFGELAWNDPNVDIGLTILYQNTQTLTVYM